MFYFNDTTCAGDGMQTRDLLVTSPSLYQYDLILVFGHCCFHICMSQCMRFKTMWHFGMCRLGLLLSLETPNGVQSVA